jgi:DNA-binding HxlR family transcriptional regulator
MPRFGPPTQEQIDKTQALYARHPPGAGCSPPDPRVETLVEDLIGRVADKWTMLVLEVLVEHGELRFTRLSGLVTGISQKMLTQTLRQMERDGLLTRKVHPVVPPKVEYKVTDLGLTLSAAFCGVWVWAAENLQRVEEARGQFDAKTAVKDSAGPS